MVCESSVYGIEGEFHSVYERHSYLYAQIKYPEHITVKLLLYYSVTMFCESYSLVQQKIVRKMVNIFLEKQWNVGRI